MTINKLIPHEIAHFLYLIYADPILGAAIDDWYPNRAKELLDKYAPDYDDGCKDDDN